ncbi:MAG: hypothetical protein ITG00_10835 [Flavobacterium sp.]|nr:hypothetical protein [Flavobacterium sp.]
MNLIAKYSLLISIALFSVGFGAHKFYVGIYQIDYVAEKQMVQITTRIFLDDFNEAAELKYNKQMMLGEPTESAQDREMMLKYIKESMILQINGKTATMEFMSKEIEDNVLICYFRVTGVRKINSFKIQNKILFDYVTEQQNVIQTNINGKKQSLLLTTDKSVAELRY